jgi:hypothetical protein
MTHFTSACKRILSLIHTPLHDISFLKYGDTTSSTQQHHSHSDHEGMIENDKILTIRYTAETGEEWQTGALPIEDAFDGDPRTYCFYAHTRKHTRTRTHVVANL